MSEWGPIISVGALRRAAEDTLKLWLPATVAEAARQDGRDPSNKQQLPPIRSWRRPAELTRANAAQVPAIFTSSGGLIDDTEDDGDGDIYGSWGLVVGVQLHGSSYEDTNDLVGIFCAGIRASLAQHGDLGGFAEHTVWLGEDYAQAPPEQSRTLGIGFVEFAVKPASPVLDIYGGPAEPPVDPLDPLDDRPDVDDVIVTESPLT